MVLNALRLLPSASPALTHRRLWARFKADLRPYLRGNAYLNFLWGDDARSRVREAFPASTYDRLVQIKTAYDPHNMFRFSYQLAPASVTAK